MSALRRWFAVLCLTAMLVATGPDPAQAHAADAAPADDAISIGDPAAPGQIDLYVDPLCPYSGKFVRSEGAELGKRIEAGRLHLNLRFVSFLDKYSASGTYDNRAIYAAFVVADESHDSGITWRFIEQIYSTGNQPHEKGDTDLDNGQLADLAGRAGAPQAAQDRIRLGLPIGFNPDTIAADNLAALDQLNGPGVPLVVIDGRVIDTDTNWLARLPRA